MIRAALIFLSLLLAMPAPAQTLGALARALPEGSSLTGTEQRVTLQLALSQPVPFRVFTLDNPARVVIDFRDVDFRALPEEFDTAALDGVAMGGASTPGWSRMVLELATPMRPEVAAMETDPVTGAARVTVTMVATDAESFAAAAGPPPGVSGVLLPVVTPAPPPRGDDVLVVMLDPGHGGVDPGALREGHTEAGLILSFARELRDTMRRTGRIEVAMTRDGDVFVPLPTRVSLARAAGADLFISLHADAIAEGRAQGATVYILSETASDAATEALAEQHDRADLLQGVDLTGTDDEVASVLMDLVRTETAPRSRAFADALVARIEAAGLDLHTHPLNEGAFSVLKAADFPAVLLEIGFLSEGGDLENILDPEWRARMQAAITDAVIAWADADAAAAALRRQ